MTLNFNKCTTEDFSTLQEISFETYTDTFGEFNTPENMKAYLDGAYNKEKLISEIQTKDSTFYFLYDQNQLVGYLKLNQNQAQTEDISKNALEIERLYVRPDFKRRGYGRKLMEFAIQEAKNSEKELVWLGVWEHNEPAKAFYQSMGYQQQGSHSFFMGDDEQTDYIMVKKLK